MRAFPVQTTPAGNDDSVSIPTKVTAANMNDCIQEIQDAIGSAGMTLIALIASADNTQLSQAISRYIAAGTFYEDSGAANAYVLSPQGSFAAPAVYINDQTVRWIAGVTNSTASTINVNGVGVVDLRDAADAALVGGEISTTTPNTARHNSSTGRFELMESTESLAADVAQNTSDIATNTAAIASFPDFASQGQVDAGTASDVMIAPDTLSGTIGNTIQGFDAATVVVANAENNIIVGGGSAWGALPPGSDGQLLTIAGGAPAWADDANEAVPASVEDAIILGGAASWETLAGGTDGHVLTMVAGTPAYAAPQSGVVSYAELQTDTGNEFIFTGLGSASFVEIIVKGLTVDASQAQVQVSDDGGSTWVTMGYASVLNTLKVTVGGVATVQNSSNVGGFVFVNSGNATGGLRSKISISNFSGSTGDTTAYCASSAFSSATFNHDGAANIPAASFDALKITGGVLSLAGNGVVTVTGFN